MFQLTEDTHRRLLDGAEAPPQPLVRRPGAPGAAGVRPDGSLYIADFAVIHVAGDEMVVPPGTGVLWRFAPKEGC